MRFWLKHPDISRPIEPPPSAGVVVEFSREDWVWFLSRVERFMSGGNMDSGWTHMRMTMTETETVTTVEMEVGDYGGDGEATATVEVPMPKGTH